MQRCFDIVSTSGTDIVSMLCNLTSDFVLFLTWDQGYWSTTLKQRWLDVEMLAGLVPENNMRNALWVWWWRNKLIYEITLIVSIQTFLHIFSFILFTLKISCRRKNSIYIFPIFKFFCEFLKFWNNDILRFCAWYCCIVRGAFKTPPTNLDGVYYFYKDIQDSSEMFDWFLKTSLIVSIVCYNMYHFYKVTLIVY